MPAAFTLPALPWEKNALQPHISEETIDYHYGKHHATYVTKLNGLVEQKPELGEKTLEEIICTETGGAFNNAAQIFNHTFYWKCMSPNGGGEPSGTLGEAIQKKWGSFEAFKKAFSDTAATHFGSGWAWLVKEKDGSIAIVGAHDADCPIKDGKTPLLTCDVWEHAYYIDYRNVRPDYIAAFWKVVNWEFAQANFEN